MKNPKERITVLLATIDGYNTYVIADGTLDTIFPTPDILRITWNDDQESFPIIYADTVANAEAIMHSLSIVDNESHRKRNGYYIMSKLFGSEATNTIDKIRQFINENTFTEQRL